MWRAIPILCWLFLLAQSHGQDVFVPRELKAVAVTHSDKEPASQIEKAPPAKESVVAQQPVMTEPVRAASVSEPPANLRPEKVQSTKAEPAKVPALEAPPANPRSEKIQSVKAESVKRAAVKEAAANSRSEKVRSVIAEPMKAPAMNLHSKKIQSEKADPGKMLPASEPAVDLQLSNRSMETASTRLADGFDFPVGKPEAEGYYKARGFRSGGHIGEDWDGVRGGDTDLKDPIYCIGDGIVVFARDVHRGWGNVVIVRHAFRESGRVKHIDSLYGHLNSILVRRGQKVARGQQIGTMGTAHGQYDAHLHLEIRKNLEIGMSRSKFQRNFSNYYDPSQFIESHRHLSGGGTNFRVAMNTFTHDWAYHFDDSPNYSVRKQSTAQSAAALKQVLSSNIR